MVGAKKNIGTSDPPQKIPADDLSIQLLSQALEQTADIVMITNQQGVIEYVNPAFERCTGYSRDEVLGESPNILHSSVHDTIFYDHLWATIRKGKAYRGVIVNQRKNGSHYHEEKTITPLIGSNGTITHYVSTGKDVTDRIETQQKLRELAYFDSLTELPNRHYLKKLLSQAVQQAKRRNGTLAVLFLDLDRFKQINDSLGHTEGDRLLQEVAGRLRSLLREGDTVGRSGGDEFVILIHEPRNLENVVQVADKLVKRLAEPFIFNGHEHQIGVSIGISIFPQDKQTPEELLKAADMAMYQAKAGGGVNFHFFSSEIESRVLERIDLERSLRLGVTSREMVNFYQPQFDLSSGKLIGTEALVRWFHPVQGMIGPDRFIPVAEETGDIIFIGEQVLAKACRQMVDWHDKGLLLKYMSINLSPRQLAHPGIIPQVKRMIDEHCFQADNLVLELTESSLMQRPEQAAKTLASLKDLGVRLSVDDFGTGYSSLSYLRKFPLDCVKIDRSFIKEMELDKAAPALVDGIIRLAHSLDMTVIAEGVENQAQLDMLCSMGCEGAQGYLLGRPMSSEELNGQSIADAESLICSN